MTASKDRGFTLVEVLVAILLLVTISAGVAQVLVLAASSGRSAREQSSTTMLAAAKMEQLRSLTWGFEPFVPDLPAVPRSDGTTDLSSDPPEDDGPGLAASPAGTLSSNVPPYVDYLDRHGRYLGTGTTFPPGAMFVRRWAIQPLPDDPSRTLVLQVFVTSVRAERSRAGAPWQQRSGEDAHLVSVLTRKGR